MKVLYMLINDIAHQAGEDLHSEMQVRGGQERNIS